MSTHKIIYNRHATTWNEALPLGNGALGAMVYGNPEMEIIQLNLDTLWSGEPNSDKYENKEEAVEKIRELIFKGEYVHAEKLAVSENKFLDSQTYLPLGDLHINPISFDGAPIDYKRVLDMQNAVHECSYYRENTKPYGIEHYTKMFISNPDDVMVIKVGDTFGKRTSFTMYYNCVLKNDIKTDGDTVYVSGIAPYKITERTGEVLYYDENSNAVRFHIQIRVIPKGGTLVSEGNRISVFNADEALIILSAETNFVNYKTIPDKNKNLPKICTEKIEKAQSKGYNKLYEAHTEYFKEKYNRVSLSLTEENEYDDAANLIHEFKESQNSLVPVEILFNFGRYLMISGSAPGSQAMNLQGIWNKELLPPWKCNYTVNINTEMNYWLCEACNLPEFHLPLMDFIREVTEAGEKTAKELYGCCGSVAHHNIDLWRKTTPASGASWYALWPMSLAWLTRHLWEHYIYNMDKDFLENEVYPLIEKSVEFFLDWLIEKNGVYITCPSTSPENRFVYGGEICAVVRESAMDIGILKELFGNYIKASEILAVENEKTKKACHILENLAEYKIADDGRLIEWDCEHEEAQPGHRHFSHLYGIYPGNSIKKAGNKFVEAAKKSLEFRLKNGSGYTGWSCAWVINLYAAFANGEGAYRYIKKLICDSMYMNFFGAHPPFQIDGNFGVVSGICQMLVQSEFDENESVIIDILPAIPKEWKKGSIRGIKVKGNILLDISWENNKAMVCVNAKGQKYILKCDNFVLEEKITG